ncbi:MAG: Chaperone protein DnaJ [Candidatus Scalindua arabica]|uniref:Chaperone protein DnaJ n=1 Tax=Candidatus Scalindua arabica TaxID=1127984 RepID=A0A941W276_9BACT|nr:Chaperone protein DnaJ [Candidatus Scalindua arabica]
MINYYQVLQVQEGSDRAEIRNSFRKLAKKYHPDKTKANGISSEDKIKLLIKAYKTLSDTEKRIHYDTQLQNSTISIRDFYYKENPKRGNGKYDLRSQAKIVLNDLLNKNGPQAVRNYERLKEENKEFELLAFLNLKDYLDCKFLLAEEYEKQEQYELAFKMYEYVYQEENGNPARKHLLEEIKERILRLSCKKLAKLMQPDTAITYLTRALNLKLSKNEEAFIYKKIADCYVASGEWDNALERFNKALSLCPNLKGAQTLKNKLNKHFSQENYFK